jgi:hypothetical protein
MNPRVTFIQRSVLLVSGSEKKHFLCVKELFVFFFKCLVYLLKSRTWWEGQLETPVSVSHKPYVSWFPEKAFPENPASWPLSFERPHLDKCFCAIYFSFKRPGITSLVRKLRHTGTETHLSQVSITTAIPVQSFLHTNNKANSCLQCAFNLRFKISQKQGG